MPKVVLNCAPITTRRIITPIIISIDMFMFCILCVSPGVRKPGSVVRSGRTRGRVVSWFW